MSDRTKRVWAIAGTSVLVYVAIVPMLWPEPAVDAVYPSEAGTNDTLPITVLVSAWHRNVDIGQVRFYVDYTATTAVGPKGTFYPELLVQREARRFVGPFARNPITWPYTQRFDGEISLAKYIDQGLIGPGELVGKIDVTFNYCSGRGGRYATPDRTRTATKSVPFQIAIHE
jgi:hypothetical protein